MRWRQAILFLRIRSCVGELLRASLPLVALIVLLTGSPLYAQAQTNPRATTFPAEGSQVLATKGDVTYWFEQARDYGTKAVGISALGGSTAKRPQFVLDLSNGKLACTLAALATREKIEENNFSAPLNDCAFTYSDTGHVRVLTPNPINGAIDRLFDGPGPDAKILTTADGGFNGEEDDEGNTVVEQGSGNECGINALCWLGRLPGILVSGIAYLLLVLSSMILFVAGTVFNWVVIRTVFQFGLYFGTSEGMLIAWGVLRDIANIALLFGFIFMGIATILNTPNMEGYSAKKALPHLIIFAVLLNFSLFATQGIIDVANGFAAIFNSYAGEQTCDTATSNSGGQSTEDCAGIGISGKIMAAAGMNHIPSLGDTASGLTGMLDRPYTTATMLVILSVLVTITAVVLLAAAIMLVVRVVVLSLLMVTSPVGFAGMAIPALQGLAKDWWHQLINQSFFAPLYLLMIFISLKLVDGLQSGGATIPDAILGNVQGGGTVAGNMQVLVVYAVVIGFMIASLMIAKKLGAAGAGFATNAASAVVYGSLARGMNFATGGAARLARQSIQNSRLRNTGVGRVLVNRGLRPLEKTNLDMRRIAGMGSVLGAGGITAGAKPAEHATIGEMRHQAIDIASGKYGRELTAEYERERARESLDNVHEGTPLNQSQERQLAQMSVKELEQLHGIREGVTSLARSLSPEQFAALMKSDSLNETEKTNLRNSRLGLVNEQLTAIRAGQAPGATAQQRAAGTAARTALRAWAVSDLAQLNGSDSAALLADPEFATQLSDDQFDTLVKNDRLTATEKAALRGTRESRFNAANAQGTLQGMSREQIEKLDGRIVASAPVLAALGTSNLISASNNSKFDPGQRAAINQELASRLSPAMAGATLSALSSDQVSKIDGALLAQQHVYEQLGVEDFEKIRGAGNLTQAQRTIIGRHVNQVATSSNDPRQAEFFAYLNTDPRISSYWPL